MGEEVKVFRTWSSPFALRVVWALKLKAIDFETVSEDLSNKSSSLLQYNPVYQKVPVLLHNGKPICESLLILEYIDETWKQTPLLPQDPFERARARFWAKFCDDKVLPSIYNGVFLKQGKEQEEAIPVAWENLKYLEEELKGKKFFGGDKIGIVDLAIGFLARYNGVLEEILDLKLIEKQKFPLLVEWMQEFSNAPIIQENWPDRDKLVAKFKVVRETCLAK